MQPLRVPSSQAAMKGAEGYGGRTPACPEQPGAESGGNAAAGSCHCRELPLPGAESSLGGRQSWLGWRPWGVAGRVGNAGVYVPPGLIDHCFETPLGAVWAAAAAAAAGPKREPRPSAQGPKGLPRGSERPARA